MAQVLEKCKNCRREGEKLFLKGERCNSVKCSFTRRSYAPGIHGISSARKKISEYAIQLRAKQKVKRIYGIQETQFANYYKKADSKEGVTGELLLQQLEMRFDNIVYRMGFAGSRKESRQLVGHGHFIINGKKINIPSYQLLAGDKIEVSATSKKLKYFTDLTSEKIKKNEYEWLESDLSKLKGEIKRVPTREELDPNINEQLIVELYSK